MTSMDITREQFESYVEVQVSGVTNMIDLTRVSELSGLEPETIMAIQKDYSALKLKYPPVATCPTCRKEFTGEDAQFVKEIGECGSCDHVRGDINDISDETESDDDAE